MSTLPTADQAADDVWYGPFGPESQIKLGKLSLVWKATAQQQVGRFLEGRVLREVSNVVAAILERRGFAVDVACLGIVDVYAAQTLPNLFGKIVVP